MTQKMWAWGIGHWAMGIKDAFSDARSNTILSMPHAQCPMPNSQCPNQT
ncbi:hypothetical protein [Tolypothrix sp. VBCCA 56010]